MRFEKIGAVQLRVVECRALKMSAEHTCRLQLRAGEGGTFQMRKLDVGRAETSLVELCVQERGAARALRFVLERARALFGAAKRCLIKSASTQICVVHDRASEVGLAQVGANQ